MAQDAPINPINPGDLKPVPNEKILPVEQGSFTQFTAANPESFKVASDQQRATIERMQELQANQPAYPSVVQPVVPISPMTPPTQPSAISVESGKTAPVEQPVVSDDTAKIQAIEQSVKIESLQGIEQRIFKAGTP